MRKWTEANTFCVKSFCLICKRGRILFKSMTKKIKTWIGFSPICLIQVILILRIKYFFKFFDVVCYHWFDHTLSRKTWITFYFINVLLKQFLPSLICVFEIFTVDFFAHQSDRLRLNFIFVYYFVVLKLYRLILLDWQIILILIILGKYVLVVVTGCSRCKFPSRAIFTKMNFGRF